MTMQLAPIEEDQLIELGDMACESRHRMEWNRTCTVEVEYRVRCCHRQLNICAAAARAFRDRMRDPNSWCEECALPSGECWELHTI